VAVNDPAVCAEIFAQLKWAALTAPKGTPVEGEEPTAYIMVLRRKDYELPKVSPYDIGAAVQTICLGAVSLGLATCWLKSVNYPKLTNILGLPENAELDSVVAIGVPGEFPLRDEIAADKDGIEVIKYYRDDNNQQHVPKRALETILHQQKYGG
jgi:nitroreductase